MRTISRKKLRNLASLNWTEGDKLGFSELQFAYQAATSTTVCSWAVSAVIDTFNRSGTPVYAVTMDMSKAFDMVQWFHLFLELRKRKVGGLYLRLMTDDVHLSTSKM